MSQEPDGHVTSKNGGHMIHRERLKTLKEKEVQILGLNVSFAGREWLLLWDPVLLLNIYQQ